MSAINVTNIQVLDNPAIFTSPFRFEVTFECTAPISEDLEWKVVYVGSAASPDYDQELEAVLVGPVPVGVSKFVLSAPAPSVDKIPDDDILGATVVMVTCFYKGQEFIRVGYWINNTYGEALAEGEALPKPVPADKIIRSVLADKPRVTRFHIDSWA